MNDDDLAGAAQAWRLAVAAAFVVVAVVLVVGVWRVGAARSDSDAWPSQLGVGLAVVGSSWWIVRGGQILIGDWDASFKLVHSVLAVIVLGLSVMVWRTRGYARQRYG